MTADPSQLLAWLVNRARISDLLYAFASALDTRDWEGYVANYADGGFIELPDPQSATGATFRMFKEQMLQQVPRSLGRYRATHHISSNHQIEINGDLATTRSYLQAVHVGGTLTDHWTAGGWYDCRLKQVAGAWKFAEVRLTPVWLAGKIAGIRPQE
jgi:hypothetical protein